MKRFSQLGGKAFLRCGDSVARHTDAVALRMEPERRVSLEKGDGDVLFAEALREGQAAEAAADDENVGGGHGG